MLSPGLLLFWLPSLLCGVHVVRTGQPMYWLWLLVIAPGLGPAIYFLAVMLPELMGGRTGTRAARALRAAGAPQREYREAKRALEDAPTVGAHLRVGHAAMAVQRFAEAEAAFRAARAGHFADDAVVLTAHANALLELGRHAEALEALEAANAQGAADTPEAALAYARAYEGLNRYDDADAPYRFAADRLPGLEAGARYVAFMARAGRREDAEIGLAELDRRLAKAPPHFRAEARRWRDHAAQAVRHGAL